MCRTCGTKFKFVNKKNVTFLFRAAKIWAVNTIFCEIVNCSNCYCSTFRADNNIIDICSNLVNPFEKVDSSSFIYLLICSNGVEQSRFWCRADFLSRWISSRWPFSLCQSGAITLGSCNCYKTKVVFWYNSSKNTTN